MIFLAKEIAQHGTIKGWTSHFPQVSNQHWKRNISIRKGDRSLAQTRNVKPKTGFDAILQSNQVTKFNRQSSGDRKEQTWQIMSVCRNQITNGQSSGLNRKSNHDLQNFLCWWTKIEMLTICFLLFSFFKPVLYYLHHHHHNDNDHL